MSGLDGAKTWVWVETGPDGVVGGFNDPASPCSASIFSEDGTWKFTGLTIRQRAALMAMQSHAAMALLLAAHGGALPKNPEGVAAYSKVLASICVEMADAVLKMEAETR